MAGFLRAGGFDAWTAYDAHLEEAADDEVIAYAADKDAIAVTSNKDFVRIARRLRAARVLYLAVREPAAKEATARAIDWLRSNRLPPGRVLKVPRRAQVRVMSPLPW